MKKNVFAVPPAAAARTYQCRCESYGDAELLQGLLLWATERCEIQRVDPVFDVTMQFTVKDGTLSFGEIRWLFSLVEDAHVALETLRLASEYDGRRSSVDDNELAKVTLTADARQSCAASLARLNLHYRAQLACIDDVVAALQASPRRQHSV